MPKLDFSAAKLKARRVKLGLTTNRVLAKLREMGHDNASRQLLGNYESGVNVPGFEYALALASIYKCSLHDITDTKQEEK